MPATPGLQALPRARDEADHLTAIFPGAIHLVGAQATRDAVLGQMKSHSWFHFAVHGITSEHTPFDGGLQLSDGRLTIRDLIEHRLPDARFSYLSACATHQGSPAIPDETVTIAAALSVAGCQNAIAALWQVDDEQSADFARLVYQYLVTTADDRPALRPDASARAVREAARDLRNAHRNQPERWAAYVCVTST